MNLPEINRGLRELFKGDVKKTKLDNLLTIVLQRPVLDVDTFTSLFPNFYDSDESLEHLITDKYGKEALQFAKETTGAL